jgi:hypothetical protein
MLELLELTLLDVVVATVWVAATLLIAAWASATTGLWLAQRAARVRRTVLRRDARTGDGPPRLWDGGPERDRR